MKHCKHRIRRRYGHDDYDVAVGIKTLAGARKELNAWRKLNPTAAYYIVRDEEAPQ